MQSRRRLAAILAADVAGYTRLMEQDTDGTVAAWRLARDTVIEPGVAEFSGEIIKFTGDGFLAEFTSVHGAVSCALKLQLDLSVSTLGFRFGINLGDITDDGKDIHGEGVNIAARLEALAEPGSICISGDVYNQVKNRINAPYRDMGEQRVKHVSQPIRVFQIEASDSAPPQAAARPRISPTPAILLEPFEVAGNVGPLLDAAEEFHEELLMAITRRSGIRVVTQRDNNVPVSFVLQGRCRLRGERCRISVSLSMAETQEVLFSQRFEGRLGDDEFIETSVVRLSASLRTKVMALMGMSVEDEPDETLDIQNLLTKAASHLLRYDPDKAVSARHTLERAVELAPDNPMALAMLARSLCHMVPFGLVAPSAVDCQRARELTDRAISLDANLDFLFHTRSCVRLWLLHDHEGAIADAKHALRVNPAYHKGTQDLGMAQVFAGQPEHGAQRLEQTVNEMPPEPITPLLFALAGLGRLLIDDVESAIKLSKEGYERQPNMPTHGLIYAAALTESNDGELTRRAHRVIRESCAEVTDLSFLPFSKSEDAIHLQSTLARLVEQTA